LERGLLEASIAQFIVVLK